ncbi:hypothetical protein NQP46_29680 [Streptomyces albus]|nr:hypothetical protein NQP46_29680 [Streptomyces albus]
MGLCVAFLFAPAGRFGYFALPLLLVVWSRLATGALPGARSPAPLLRRGAPPTERPAALSRATPPHAAHPSPPSTAAGERRRPRGRRPARAGRQAHDTTPTLPPGREQQPWAPPSSSPTTSRRDRAA